MKTHNVIILKQLEEGYSISNKPVNAIVRVENESDYSRILASFINLSALVGGEYYLYIFGKNNAVYTFPLPQKPTNFTKTQTEMVGVENGFGACLVALRADIPVSVAFGKTENFDLALKTAKKLVADNCLSRRKQSPKEIELPVEYNDEAVATVNYYELDEQISDKNKLVIEQVNDKLSDENGNPSSPSKEEEKEEQSYAHFFENETNDFFNTEQEDTPFYLTQKAELNAIFNKFPEFNDLKCFFPDSRWAKIYYDKERYYVVGVVKEDGVEKYICYGVPGEYSPTPPKELKGYCQFIPLSVFNLHGDGFWMMFQDAITGNCIFPK